MGPDPIVITGRGMVTSLGLDVDSTWQAVKAGRCGMRVPTAIESPTSPSCEMGQAPELPADWHPGAEREVRYLKKALAEAVRSAAIHPSAWPYAPARCGLILGTTLAGMRSGGRFLRSGDTSHLRHFLAGQTLAALVDHLPLAGFTTTACAACASGLSSIGLALTLLREGAHDLVIAGGYDTLSEYAQGGFASLRLLTDGAISPFAATRSGMKLSEGYGLVILERAGDAKTRGARIRGVIAGFGESSDAHHLTQPEPGGEGAARAIRAALAEAGLEPQRIGLVAAHATATPNNDSGEFRALRAVLREHLPATPLVAFKSHLGHALGGAGAVELILTLRAMCEASIPPTANFNRAGLEFSELNMCGHARDHAIDCALNISLGFGGANCALVVTRADSSAPAARPPRAPSRVKRDRSRCCISGIGALGPGFTGVSELVEALIEPQGRLSQCGEIVESQLDGLIDARRTRRMSAYVKYLLAATTLAIRDAEIDDVAEFIESAAAIVGTAHGSTQYSAEYYRGIVERGLEAANPMLFAEGVPNAGAAHLSMMLGLKGPSQTLIGTRTAGVDALILAAARIRSGEWQRAIVGAAEEFSPIVNRAYAEAGAQQRRPVTNESADERKFLNAAGGAAVFIVESERSAIARGARVYATITEWSAARAPTGRDRRLHTGPRARPARFPEMFSVSALLAAASAMVLGSSNGGAENAPFLIRASDWGGDVRAVRFVPGGPRACEVARHSIRFAAAAGGQEP